MNHHFTTHVPRNNFASPLFKCLFDGRQLQQCRNVEARRRLIWPSWVGFLWWGAESCQGCHWGVWVLSSSTFKFSNFYWLDVPMRAFPPPEICCFPCWSQINFTHVYVVYAQLRGRSCPYPHEVFLDSSFSYLWHIVNIKFWQLIYWAMSTQISHYMRGLNQAVRSAINSKC